MIKRYGAIFLFLLLYSLPCRGYSQQREEFCVEPYSLEKIVILKEAVVDKIYIDRDYLEASSIKSIPEAISLLGIDTQSRSLNYGVQTDFSLCGLSFEGLTILLDGQRINDPQTGHHNSDIPLCLEDIAAIELDSLRGTVNITSKIPQESKIIFENSYGEYRTYSSRLSISNKRDNLGLRLSLARSESGGFRYDTDFKILTASLSSNLKLSAMQEAFLLLGYDQKEFGAYDFYTPNQGYPSQEWTKTHILNSGLNLETGNLLFKPRFLWRRHRDKFMLDKTQIKSNYLNHHCTDVYASSLSVQFLEQGAFGRPCLAAGYEEEEINSTGLGGRSRTDYSLSIDTQKELKDALTLEGGLRFDYFDSFKDKTTGSIILSYLLNHHQRLSLGVSSIMRRPTFTELYYEDPTTLGNAYLLPEEWITYQLSYDYQPKDLDLRIAIFLRQEDNLINWVKRQTNQLWQARNMLAADCLGIQAHLKVKFNSSSSGGFNYTYIDKQLKGSGWLYKYGPNYAAHLFNSFFKFDLPELASVIELQYKKRPQRNGWFLVNLSLWRRVNNNAKIFYKVSNLFNAGYQDIEGISSPGRWAEAGLRLEW